MELNRLGMEMAVKWAKGLQFSCFTLPLSGGSKWVRIAYTATPARGFWGIYQGFNFFAFFLQKIEAPWNPQLIFHKPFSWMPFFLLRSSFFHFSLIKLFQRFISTRWYVVLYRHCACPPPPIIFNGSIYVKIAALFLQNIAPPQKSSNESRSAIESYYVTRLQVPLRSPVWYTNKRCVFNYLPLRVTIDPFISYFLTNF